MLLVYVSAGFLTLPLAIIIALKSCLPNASLRRLSGRCGWAFLLGYYSSGHCSGLAPDSLFMQRDERRSLHHRSGRKSRYCFINSTSRLCFDPRLRPNRVRRQDADPTIRSRYKISCNMKCQRACSCVAFRRCNQLLGARQTWRTPRLDDLDSACDGSRDCAPTSGSVLAMRDKRGVRRRRPARRCPRRRWVRW